MDAMKRTLISVAAAFAVASTSAVAQGVKMSDEQLDQITAAGAVVLIANPGPASVERRDGEICINCATLAPTPNQGKVGGAVLTPKGALRCIGGGVSVNFGGISLPVCF